MCPRRSKRTRRRPVREAVLNFVAEVRTASRPADLRHFLLCKICPTFGKPCRATPDPLGHIGGVVESAISVLQQLRPLIKQRWESLLRAEPVVSPLANPDTLVFRMDQTLDQLVSALHTRSFRAWLKHHPVLFMPLRDSCHCQINPLLAYYSTGDTALREVASLALGNALPETLLLYHGLAQREIEALCGACCQRGTEACATHEALVGALPALRK